MSPHPISPVHPTLQYESAQLIEWIENKTIDAQALAYAEGEDEDGYAKEYNHSSQVEAEILRDPSSPSVHPPSSPPPRYKPLADILVFVRRERKRRGTMARAKRASREELAKMAKEANYYYVDDEGNTQGPFGEGMIVSWYESGALTGDLLVCREGNQTYSKLAEVLPNIQRNVSARAEAAKAKVGGQELSEVIIEEDEGEDGDDEDDGDDDEDEGNETNWYYLDAEQQWQGPHPSSHIRHWAQTSFFQEDQLLVKEGESKYVSVQVALAQGLI